MTAPSPFHRGYADAWAARSTAVGGLRADHREDYLRGYEEGHEDRLRSDSPARRRPTPRGR